MPQSCRLPPVRPERDGKMIRKVMEVIHQCVGGLDVHKKMIMACRRRLLKDGQVESEVLEFGTTTLRLHGLSKWLSEWGCTHVAMESTGVLWRSEERRVGKECRTQRALGHSK